MNNIWSSEALIVIFWNVTPCSVVDSYWCFGGTAASIFRSSFHQVHPKCWYLSTRLHFVASQKIVISTLCRMKEKHCIQVWHHCFWFAGSRLCHRAAHLQPADAPQEPLRTSRGLLESLRCRCVFIFLFLRHRQCLERDLDATQHLFPAR
jgi:hypothetical protein